VNFRQRILRIVAWLRSHEPIVYLVALLIAAAAWGFIKIADEALEGDTAAFDEAVVRGLRDPDDVSRPLGPEMLAEIARDVTALGGVGPLAFFSVVAAGFLFFDRKLRMSLYLAFATGGATVASLLLKQIFSRPRPSVVPHLTEVYTSSFPSGHSMMSAAIYLTLGSLLAASIPRVTLKIYVLAVAIALSLAVGVSRVYLGVHYPTDVLAGWMAGMIWALLCWFFARWLQRKRKVEGEHETTEDLVDPPAPPTGSNA
jgi:undecaprenyl-diphosphatase